MHILHILMTNMICVHSISSSILMTNERDEWQTFGDNACHPEGMSRSPEPFAALKGKLREGEGSSSTDAEILRCAQDDS